MQISNPNTSGDDNELIPITRDITQEFLTLDPGAFQELLYALEDQKIPDLSIKIEWNDKMGIDTAWRLKAFSDSRKPDQKRTATIVATREQKYGNVLIQAGNVFASGVIWEEKK